MLERLADRSNEAPVCGTTAQELAFRALIDEAVGWLGGADEEPLRSFYERRVFDTDIDLLFHAGLDGLEDPKAARAHLAAGQPRVRPLVHAVPRLLATGTCPRRPGRLIHFRRSGR